MPRELIPAPLPHRLQDLLRPLQPHSQSHKHAIGPEQLGQLLPHLLIEVVREGIVERGAFRLDLQPTRDIHTPPLDSETYCATVTILSIGSYVVNGAMPSQSVD